MESKGEQQQQQQQPNRRRPSEEGGGGSNHPPAQPCPRCNSSNTKFCYYNNYSLSQPRFFCKSCRRYWTQGGNLRSVPVGGGCRKSKRPKHDAGSSSSGSGSCSQPQLSSLMPPTPGLPDHQLILNAQDHQLSMMGNGNINTTNTATNGNNTPLMMSHNFFAGGTSGFLSSLAAMQGGMNQPLNFGPNLGLLHGFGLPNFDPNHPAQNQNQEESLQMPYTTREIGSSSTSPMAPEWTLRMLPGPAAAETSTSNNNRNRNHNQDNNTNNNDDDTPNEQQWPDFLGNSGLDDGV